jgi:tetratricopeptide (TPR) repeat protein
VPTALEHLDRGREASNAGRHALAQRLLTRALEQAEDGDTRARCLMSLAYVAAERGELGQGLELCEEALAEPGVTSGVCGLVHSQLGLLQMRAGDAAAALSAFDRAEHLIEPDAIRARAILHLNRGSVFIQQREAERAIEDFGRARALAPTETIAAKAEHNLGTAEHMRGRLVEALRHMERAAEVLDPVSPVLEAVGATEKAEVLSECGLPEEAAASLHRAARAFAVRRLRQSQAEAELARARILLLGHPKRAGVAARKASRLFRGRGSQDWAWRADAVAFAAAVRNGRGLAMSLASADELHAQLRRRRLRADAQLVALHAASASLALEDLDGARGWLRRARVRAEDPLPTRLLDREVRARVARRQGRRAPALGHLRAGLDDLHSWLSAYGSLDLQSSAAGHGRGLTRLGLDLAVEDGRPSLVFEWAERSRVLNSRVSPARPPASTADELRELRGQAAGAPSGNRCREARHDATQVDGDRLRDRIRQHGWYTAASGPAARPADLADVQAALDAEDVLVSLAVAGDRIIALSVAPDAAGLTDLGPLAAVRDRVPRLVADLETAAGDGLPVGLRGAVLASLDQQLADLGELLLTPVAAGWKPGTRLVLVPTGRLNGVPWTLLPQAAGRPVTIARSATHWLSLTGRGLPTGAVAFARGPRLPYAAEEIAAASAAWPRADVDLDATADSIAAMAERADVLHVAAHGRHEGDSPMFSGVELHDGLWFGYDIDQLGHVPDLVVLSACEVGSATVRSHEYLVGLATAWLHAGAQSVIASPLAVNDQTAAEMLPLVHAGLAAGRAPAVALAEAMAVTEHPGPFACFGRGW